MDKNSTIIGLALLIGGIVLMMWQSQQIQQNPPLPETVPQEESAPGNTDRPDGDKGGDPASSPGLTRAVTEDDGDSLVRRLEEEIVEVEPETIVEEEIHSLENEYIRVDFTNYGGAIKQVAMKEYAAVQGEPQPYLFNEFGELPALSISRDAPGGELRAYAPPYKMTRKDGTSIEFRREEKDGLVIIRTYQIDRDTEGPTPYTLKHSTRLANYSDSSFAVDSLYLNLGTAAPDNADKLGMSLNAGWFDGEDFDSESIRTFTGGGFLFFKSDPKDDLLINDNFVWASVKNQFFTGILTPEKPGSALYLEPVEFPMDPETKAIPKGITGSLRIDIEPVSAGTERVLNMQYYVGPKEYDRLSLLGHKQDKVMQFGWGIIGFIGKLLYTVINAVQEVVINWGFSIILVTIFLRLLLWPLTAKAAESSKRMQKIQEPMKELREKYKDNPQKLNQEMMKLWKQHKVNPMAGCFPILIQIPIFIAFFYMLRSSSELRFAHFLWINDLSLPDTIATLGGFPINLLPLIMGVTMFFQMKMTPTPSVDNTQAAIMRFMPLIFLFFCYNFSSGLVLYWTTSNLMSILQQVITNRRREREENGDGEGGDSKPDGKTPVSPTRKMAKAHTGRAKVRKKR